MALKDLIADSAALTEKAIEDIIAPYISYDPKMKQISFTAKAKNLPSKHKIVLYLVALHGWPFVTDESLPTTAKPADLEEALGIRGGTLRPILKSLKEAHYLIAKGSRYGVQAASLNEIKAMLAGETSSSRAVPSKSGRRKDTSTKNETDSAGKDGSKGKRKTHAKGVDLGAMFRGWIADGYFKQKRSMKDVKQKFRQKGVMVENTTLPTYFLAALRDDLLEREQAEVDGRKVWVYWQAK
jgi:hypothetical protein